MDAWCSPQATSQRVDNTGKTLLILDKVSKGDKNKSTELSLHILSRSKYNCLINMLTAHSPGQGLFLFIQRGKVYFATLSAEKTDCDRTVMCGLCTDSVRRRCCSVWFSGTLRKSNEPEEFTPRRVVQCGISLLSSLRGSSGRRSGTLKCVLPRGATLTFSCSPNQGFKKPQMLACHRE